MEAALVLTGTIFLACITVVTVAVTVAILIRIWDAL